MLVRKSQSKKKATAGTASGIPLDSSLTSIEWLPKMQIGENPLPPPALPTTTTTMISNQSSLPVSSSLPVTGSAIHIPTKMEAHDVELPTSTVHSKPPYSYVTLIRQAIMSATLQRMTLNEIYQWIVDSYPYFRTAPPKWKVCDIIFLFKFEKQKNYLLKNSIRHNLSLNKCFKRLQRSTNDPGKVILNSFFVSSSLIFLFLGFILGS
jgi:hypothetical protein